MKKLVLMGCMVAGMMLIWGMKPASSAVGNLTAPNKHNLSAVSGTSAYRAQSESQICIFCHTPHTALSEGPLWNHRLSTASYTVSVKPGVTGTQLSSPLNPPDGSSKLCLSCHDGTVPLGAVQNTVFSMRTVGLGPLTGSSVIGTNLSGHHLISIEYNGNLVTDKQAQCGTISMKLAAPPGAPYLQPTHNVYTPACADPDGCSDPANWYSGVQCTSCHDPHYDQTSGVTKFLRDTSAAQGGWPWLVYDNLCMHCHAACP